MKRPFPRQQHPSPSPKSVRIVLVDDHPMVRERLAHVIEQEAGMRVCGEAESRNDALQVIADTRPDLAIVDLSLKNSHGLELIKDLTTLHPAVKILVVSLHEEALYAERSLHAGARGYISKQDATRNILVAIERVLAGEVYLSESASKRIVSKAANASSKESLFLSRLTDRELQVFERIGENKLNTEIAAELGLGVSTVETYRARIREKLELTDPKELIRQAIHWKRSIG